MGLPILRILPILDAIVNRGSWGPFHGNLTYLKT